MPSAPAGSAPTEREQSRGEEIANALTHGVSALLGTLAQFFTILFHLVLRDRA